MLNSPPNFNYISSCLTKRECKPSSTIDSKRQNHPWLLLRDFLTPSMSVSARKFLPGPEYATLDAIPLSRQYAASCRSPFFSLGDWRLETGDEATPE